MPRLTVRAYARHRGISHTAVLKAIASHRIVRGKDGLIDADSADRDWTANTDQSRPRNSVTGNPRRRRLPEAPPLPMGAPDPPPATDGATGKAVGTYAAARAVRESYMAKMARLRHEQLEGRLVDADEVREVAFRAARETRRRLRELPAELAASLAAVTDPVTIESVLAAAIDRVCGELTRSLSSQQEEAGGGSLEEH
jgi:hypothetical protein